MIESRSSQNGGALSVYTNFSGVSKAYGFNVGNNITGSQALKAGGLAEEPTSVSAID